MSRYTRQFRISSPGTLPVDAVLDVDGRGWSLSLNEWGGSGAVTIQGTDDNTLKVLQILSGALDPTSIAEHVGAREVPPRPVVYHLGSGGFVHQLNLLGNSFVYCQAFGATLVPIMDCTPEWGLPFHEFFEPLAPEFANREAQADLLARIGEMLDLPIADRREIAFTWNTDAPVNYALTGKLAGTRGLGLDWSTQPTAAVLTAGTPWPPEGMARGWPAVIGQITLQDWVKQDLGRRIAPLPARYIGAHYRNTDISSDIRAVAESIRAAAGGRDLLDVLWATDDVESRAEIVALLPEFRVHSLATLPSVRGMPGSALHFLDADQLGAAGLTKTDLLLASLADMLALIRAEVFIPSGNTTGWTGFVEGMRSSPTVRDAFFGPPD